MLALQKDLSVATSTYTHSSNDSDHKDSPKSVEAVSLPNLLKSTNVFDNLFS